MNKLLRSTLFWRAVLVLAIFSVAFYTAYRFLQPPPPPLPFYDPADVNPDLVDPAIARQGRNHHILPFELTDQEGSIVTEQRVEGKVFMVDFFFTTCPSICKDMARQKRLLQELMVDNDDFLILSHSVMPEHDSVSVLAEYANLNKAEYGKWYLLTGERDSIYRLARRSYLVAREPEEGSEDHSMIHTENFVLIDRKGRIRGFYDGTSEEAVRQLAEDAKRLLQKP